VPGITGLGPVGLLLAVGELPGMGMPLMLAMGDGDAAVLPMPFMPWWRAARTWSGV
jgi:hypothetical protein